MKLKKNKLKTAESFSNMKTLALILNSTVDSEKKGNEMF